MSKHRRVVALVIMVLLAATLAACGGGDDRADDESNATSTTGEGGSDGPLHVVVSSADGLASPGLSALVQRLYPQSETRITVAAPASAGLAPAPVAEGGEPATTYAATADGYPGIAVSASAEATIQAAIAGDLDGLPADAGTPDLVVVGIGAGQLIGSLAEFSPNVPAARAAAAAGVPALVVAQGTDAAPPNFQSGALLARDWIEEHREALASGDAAAGVTILSVPSCAAGEPRGMVEVPIAADVAGRPLNVVDCSSAATDPVDDVAAFTTGFATVTELPVEPDTAASTTTAPATTAPPA